MNNQKCKIRSEIINVNTNAPIFYPYSITINKCKDSWNTINDPYARFCVPDIIKNINVKVFNLMSRTNETNHTEWHKTCKYKCRLIQVFVTINKDGMKANADVNVKN